MKVESLITFGGRCEEALEFYKKAVGAEVTALMRWKESPDAAMKAPPGYGEKIMHANFRMADGLEYRNVRRSRPVGHPDEEHASHGGVVHTGRTP